MSNAQPMAAAGAFLHAGYLTLAQQDNNPIRAQLAFGRSGQQLTKTNVWYERGR
jgi:hypothetical protein